MKGKRRKKNLNENICGASCEKFLCNKMFKIYERIN